MFFCKMRKRTKQGLLLHMISHKIFCDKLNDRADPYHSIQRILRPSICSKYRTILAFKSAFSFHCGSPPKHAW